MKYFVIGDEDAVLGFSLVGVPGITVTGRHEAEDAFRTAIEDRDVGIILITERTAELIRDRVDRYLFSEQFPLIVEIPDRRGRVEGRPGLREMVNQAIGIRL